MRVLLFGMLMSVFAAAAHAEDMWAPMRDCQERLQSHAEQSDCLQKKMHKSETELQKAGTKAKQALLKQEEEKYWIEKCLTALAEADKAFQEYKTKHCDFEATLSMGGNSAGDGRMACHIQLNEQRTHQLIATAEAFE